MKHRLDKGFIEKRILASVQQNVTRVKKCSKEMCLNPFNTLSKPLHSRSIHGAYKEHTSTFNGGYGKESKGLLNQMVNQNRNKNGYGIRSININYPASPSRNTPLSRSTG